MLLPIVLTICLGELPPAFLPYGPVTRRVLDLATLTPSKAPRNNQLVTVRVVIDSAAGESDGNVHFDCAGGDGIERSVWFRGDPNISTTKPVTVRGRLLIQWHPPRVIQGQRFKEFWELRIVDAEPMDRWSCRLGVERP